MIVNELKKRSEIFIEKIVEDDFIQGMITENLPAEAICHYLKADSVYLDKFADIYAQLFAKVPDKASKEFFLGQIDFIFKHEVGAHHFLAQVVGQDYEEIIADRAWYRSADHYIKHMYYQLNRDNLVYILAAMLPCPWIYQQVARRVLASGKISDDNPFKNWLDFYGQEGVADACLIVYFDLVAKYSERLSADEQKEVIHVFLKSCQHERQFFQMAV